MVSEQLLPFARADRSRMRRHSSVVLSEREQLARNIAEALGLDFHQDLQADSRQELRVFAGEIIARLGGVFDG